MFMIQIEESKFEKMAEYTEKMLKYGGKLMSCISEIGEHHGMSFRDDEKHRMMREEHYPYHHEGRMNYRDDDDYDEDEIHERRYRRGGSRMRGTGRYTRYDY